MAVYRYVTHGYDCGMSPTPHVQAPNRARPGSSQIASQGLRIRRSNESSDAIQIPARSDRLQRLFDSPAPPPPLTEKEHETR